MNYQTHSKQRWVGRTLVETYINDFGEPLEGIVKDIQHGNLYIVSNVGTSLPSESLKGLDILSQRKVESKDVIHHLKHKHEPAIPWSSKISVVFENDEIIVVDKPSGVPTHPSGNYMFNSLSEIVKEMYGFDSIWTCHRLDKVTSGVLILCKSRESAIKFSNLLQDKKNRVKKVYLARVKGEFPPGEQVYNCPVFAVNMNGYLQPGDLENVQADTTTVFERMVYSQELNESIVKCQPISGKFHQIRIHLRNLGYPISNDHFYNPIEASKTYFAKSNLETLLYKMLFQRYPQFKDMAPPGSPISAPKTLDLLNIINWNSDSKIKEQLIELKQSHSMDLKSRKSTTCEECGRPLFDEDHVTHFSIYLHAWRFEYDDKCFKTKLPPWTQIS
ncbi:hypothetical protein CANMA_004241 [Candida margitis]|uniref:uncharacterized protein n=1 Tax=Candida margitis TaxID=1775924 RepID=UPI002225C161|nr:uncharacterized protein CANMA_004241 [Candida margitis]KAI5958397.1 hypothetical protein CANMA_004241 [Candida margitis]